MKNRTRTNGISFKIVVFRLPRIGGDSYRLVANLLGLVDAASFGQRAAGVVIKDERPCSGRDGIRVWQSRDGVHPDFTARPRPTLNWGFCRTSRLTPAAWPWRAGWRGCARCR